jgi:predicted PurR-regulated permease PerM
MKEDSPLPFYIKTSILLLGICAGVFILYIGQDILLPIVYAFVFSILVEPLVKLMEKRIPRIIAITITVLLVIAVAGGVAYFVSSQIASFSNSLPAFKLKGNEMLLQSEGWLANEFHTSIKTIQQYISQLTASVQKGAFIGGTLATISGIVLVTILIPVYMFMILYYKDLFLGFIIKAFPKENHPMVGEVMLKSREMMQSYLVGLMLEALIVAVLNSAGLLILGIKYAILLGILGAVLNVIPFIGGIIAIALPMLVAVITNNSFSSALMVLIVYVFIQFIDNHYLVPKIVASRVRINAFVSIVVVLIAGALWGIAGMFLAIPMTAILKIVFDRVEPLQAWGFLLGDEMPVFTGVVKLFSKAKKKPDK